MITNTISQILPRLIEQLLTPLLQSALAPLMKINEQLSNRLIAMEEYFTAHISALEEVNRSHKRPPAQDRESAQNE